MQTRGESRRRERLAFNFGGGAVPSRSSSTRRSPREREPTFATAPYNEPRDWGYAGCSPFTAVLLTRPQDHDPLPEPVPPRGDLRAIIGIAPMVLHRFAQPPAGVPRHAGNDRAARRSARHPATDAVLDLARRRLQAVHRIRISRCWWCSS